VGEDFGIKKVWTHAKLFLACKACTISEH